MKYTFVEKKGERYYFRSENCLEKWDLAVPESVLVAHESYSEIFVLLPREAKKYLNALRRISNADGASVNFNVSKKMSQYICDITDIATEALCKPETPNTALS